MDKQKQIYQMVINGSYEERAEDAKKKHDQNLVKKTIDKMGHQHKMDVNIWKHFQNLLQLDQNSG